MSTTAGNNKLQERIADEGSSKEGEDGTGVGDGDEGVG